MDAKTRHELKQNELAEALAKLREFDNPSTRYTLVGIALLIVLIGGWKLWSFANQRAQADKWQRVSTLNSTLQAGDPANADKVIADLRELAGESSDPLISGYARLGIARAKFAAAMTNPDARESEFEAAIEQLEQIVSNANGQPVLLGPALYALASAYESTGQVAKAEECYDRIVSEEDMFAGSPFLGMARERIKNLDRLRGDLGFASGARPKRLPIVDGPPEPDRFEPLDEPTSDAADGATDATPAETAG